MQSKPRISNIKATIGLLLSLICLSANAGSDIKNFEFKGRKFGEPPRDQSNTQPWEMNWQALQTSLSNSDNTRISKLTENNKDLLSFGPYLAHEIQYRYFNNALFEIDVQLEQQDSCIDVREINNMIEVRYGITMTGASDAKRQKSSFSNKSILIEVVCQNSIFDEASSSKYISVLFRDLRLFKESTIHIEQEIKNKIKHKQREHNDEVRKKINF